MAKVRKERVEKGRVFLRGQTWWIAYWYEGAERRESSGSTREAAAERLLRKRLADKDAGQPVVPKVGRLKFEAMAALLEGDYAAKGHVSLDTMKRSLKHLREFFGSSGARSIDQDRVNEYMAARQADGAARATVRKEIAALSRMLKLAVEHKRLASAPRLTRPTVENTRTASFSEAELNGLLALLTHGAPAVKDEPALEPQPDLAPPVVFAGWTGWRMRSDVFTLRWDQVDFEAGTVTRWSRGTSKAPRAIVFPFGSMPRLVAVLERQRQERWRVEREQGIAVEYVFHRNGKPIHDFYAAWRAACERAKVPGRVPHDLRRTAARRLRALGMSDRDIAELCGWETIEMVTRYLGRDPAGVADRLRLKLAEAAARARAGSRSGG